MKKSNLSLLLNRFQLVVLVNALKKMFQQKVIETSYIVLEKPTLNEQLEPDISILKRYNVIVL